jgi:hypothetical protein
MEKGLVLLDQLKLREKVISHNRDLQMCLQAHLEKINILRK